MAAQVIIAENPRSGAGSGAALIDAVERELKATGRTVLRLKDPTAIRTAIETAQAQTMASHREASSAATQPAAIKSRALAPALSTTEHPSSASALHRDESLREARAVQNASAVAGHDAQEPAASESTLPWAGIGNEAKRTAGPGRAPSEAFEGVIAAGGDGTVSMLADWLHPLTPLAILPLGTENLLARHFEFPTDASAFVRRWCEGDRVRMDAGLANGKLFLVMASVGFDADVVTRLHRERTGHIRHWSYFKPLWRSIRSYRYPELRLVTDNHDRPIKARWAWIFNVPRYAMGLPIAPDANGHDGKLDLCTLRGGHLLKGLLYFIGIVFGQHRQWRDTHVERAQRVRIEGDENVAYQIDGDPGGVLPLEIVVVPERLTIIAPVGR